MKKWEVSHRGPCLFLEAVSNSHTVLRFCQDIVFNLKEFASNDDIHFLSTL